MSSSGLSETQREGTFIWCSGPRSCAQSVILGHAVLRCLFQGHHQLSLRIRKQQGKTKPHSSPCQSHRAPVTEDTFCPHIARQAHKKDLGTSSFLNLSKWIRTTRACTETKLLALAWLTGSLFPSIHSSILRARTEGGLRKGRQVTLQQDPFGDT